MCQLNLTQTWASGQVTLIPTYPERDKDGAEDGAPITHKGSGRRLRKTFTYTKKLHSVGRECLFQSHTDVGSDAITD